MRNERSAVDPERREQRMRVEGELLKGVLIACRFCRLAKADLIGRDHPITGCRQCIDGRTLGRGAKILTMQEHGAASVGFLWPHVQVGQAPDLPGRADGRTQGGKKGRISG